MATKKASDSNLTGKKYNDASAGTSKIPDVPDKPTITSVSEVDSTYLRVAFSPSNTGGVPANYVTTASPGGATVTGNSPADFTTLTEGTSYTFTVVPQTSNSISGPTSNSSNSATMPLKLYALSQTFNTSGNFTVPAGKTSIAIVGTGAGGGGGGSGYRFNAGGGGGGASTAIIENIPTNAGTVYAVTIASAGNGGSGGNYPGGSGGNAGGTTTFGNIVTFNGGSGGGGASGGNNGYEGAFVGTDGGTGANGNNSFNVGSRTAIDNDGGTVTTANAQISSFAGGGAGGSSPYGGTAGSAGAQNYPNPATQGSSGGSGNGPGGGGGASGRRGYFPDNGDIVGGPHSGGGGASGRILVYVK